MNNFYVYVWYNTQTKEVFYVGKGCKNRYKNTSNRNKIFIEYIKTHQVSVKKIIENLSEDEAFEKEQEIVDICRKNGEPLTNLMDGGYGGYSKVWNDQMREYMSKYNPMKENKQKIRMSINNPMYNEEIAKKSGEKHKRKVSINGVVYDGLVDAAKELNVAEYTVLNWCKRGYDTDGNPCRYNDEEQKEYNYKKTNSKAILIDGIYYNSLREAANAIGVKDTSPLCKALKANRPYKGHICEYANQQPSQ